VSSLPENHIPTPNLSFKRTPVGAAIFSLVLTPRALFSPQGDQLGHSNNRKQERSTAPPR
jgi:hypothetical protein